MTRRAPALRALVVALFAVGWAGWATAGAPGWRSGGAQGGPSDRVGRAPEAPERGERGDRGLDRWRYNPRERAAAGLDALEEGRTDAALRAFDAAADLARETTAEEPWALYDAGAARLLTEREAQRAVGLLERATETAPPELAPDALYNLGNARLAAGDPAGALDAYRRALRLAPDLPSAKRNLEIARKRVEDASSRPETPPAEPPRNDQETDGDDAGRPERERPPEERDGEDPQDPQDPQAPRDLQEPGGGPRPSDETSPEASGRSGKPDRADSEEEGRGAPRPLPRFHEQPDLTPFQAAALLEAIDHLERSRRRQEAAERALLNSERAKEKDW